MIFAWGFWPGDPIVYCPTWDILEGVLLVKPGQQALTKFGHRVSNFYIVSAHPEDGDGCLGEFSRRLHGTRWEAIGQNCPSSLALGHEMQGFWPPLLALPGTPWPPAEAPFLGVRTRHTCPEKPPDTPGRARCCFLARSRLSHFITVTTHLPHRLDCHQVEDRKDVLFNLPSSPLYRHS